MTDLDIPNPSSPAIKLVLTGTTVPAQFLRTFTFPTWATISIRDPSVVVEIKTRGAGSELCDTDDPDVPGKTIQVDKAHVLGVAIGGKWSLGRRSYPVATLLIRDPLGVDESFELTFASLDANNPTYLVKLLAKLLNEQLGIAIHQVYDVDEIPF